MDFNLLDYIIIIIVLLSALNGYRKGLFASVLSLLALIACLYIAYTYGQVTADYITRHFNAQVSLTEYLQKNIPILAWKPNTLIGDTTFSIFSDYCEGAFVKICRLFSAADFNVNPAAYLARILINMSGFILTFFISYLVFTIVLLVLSKLIFKGPAAKVNQLAGMLISIGKTGLLLAVFLIVVVPLLKAGVYVGNEKAVGVMRYVEGSYLLGQLQDIIDLIQIMSS